MKEKLTKVKTEIGKSTIILKHSAPLTVIDGASTQILERMQMLTLPITMTKLTLMDITPKNCEITLILKCFGTFTICYVIKQVLININIEISQSILSDKAKLNWKSIIIRYLESLIIRNLNNALLSNPWVKEIMSRKTRKYLKLKSKLMQYS